MRHEDAETTHGPRPKSKKQLEHGLIQDFEPGAWVDFTEPPRCQAGLDYHDAPSARGMVDFFISGTAFVRFLRPDGTLSKAMLVSGGQVARRIAKGGQDR